MSSVKRSADHSSRSTVHRLDSARPTLSQSLANQQPHKISSIPMEVTTVLPSLRLPIVRPATIYSHQAESRQLRPPKRGYGFRMISPRLHQVQLPSTARTSLRGAEQMNLKLLQLPHPLSLVTARRRLITAQLRALQQPDCRARPHRYERATTYSWPVSVHSSCLSHS